MVPARSDVYVNICFGLDDIVTIASEIHWAVAIYRQLFCVYYCNTQFTAAHPCKTRMLPVMTHVLKTPSSYQPTMAAICRSPLVCQWVAICSFLAEGAVCPVSFHPQFLKEQRQVYAPPQSLTRAWCDAWFSNF